MAFDEATRVRLSAMPDTAPETLRALAADPSVTVRATLAMNPSLPAEADDLLARDPDERVRALLARKLCTLTPGLSDGARTQLQKQTLDTLMALAGDEAVRVRAAIAEIVKDMPAAPRAIIQRLAHDEAIMVCEPVILFSPLLTSEDLIALVTGAPSRAPSVTTQIAVANRPGLDASVSDALVASGTDDVTLALLMNRSAQIRESTLDALVDRAATRTAWHDPLVRRPVLSPRAARSLSRIVADHLLEVLSRRDDLDPALAAELRDRIASRMDPGSEPPGQDDPEGQPTETALLEVAREGDARQAAAMLAAAAAMPLSVVRRAATLRSSKGMVSLAWKAGYSMKAGYALQILLARLSPGAALKPGPGNSFPLSVQEMRWQLDFLSGDGR